MKNKFGLITLALVLISTAVLAGCSGQAKGDGKYDYDYDSALQVGSDPMSLTDSVRAVLLTVLDPTGNPVFAQSTLGWVRDNEVVVPYQLFYLPMNDGSREPIWALGDTGISIELSLLPDPQKEDTWKKEKLGDIINPKDLVSGTVDFAVIKRAGPVIKVGTQPVLGKYEDLADGTADKVLYVTNQANGRIIVERSEINEIYTNQDGKNLFGTPGDLSFSKLGSLAFAVRDGKFELVGFLSTMEGAIYESGMAYIYYLDIQQIVDYIETIKITSPP